MPEATIKGQLVLGIRKYITEKYGEDGFEKFVKAQDADVQQFWGDKTIIPVSRVPAKIFASTYETLSNLWGKESFADGAATVAFYDLNSIMKIFMKMGSPAFVAKRMPNVWRQYFSEGALAIESATERTLVLVLKDAAVYGRGGCVGTLAWTSKALVFSGAKNLKAREVQCSFEQSAECRFEYSWD